MTLRQILVPQKITRIITKFCRDQGFGEPVYLQLNPDPEAKINDCYVNVSRKVDRDAGRILYGWSILEWPKVFLEAIHHAVWVSPSNELVDITPKQDDEQVILFAVDNSVPYEKRLIIPKQRVLPQNGKISKLAKQYVGLYQEKQKIRAEYFVDHGISEVEISDDMPENERKKLWALDHALAQVHLELSNLSNLASTS